MSKKILMKKMVVNLNTSQAKYVLLANCEIRDVGPFLHSDTALLIDLNDGLSFNVYWRYRRPETWDSFQNRQIIPSDCYICDEHGIVSFIELDKDTTLVEYYKVLEVDRKLVRNIFGFFIEPALVVGINWDFFRSLFPLKLSSLPRLFLWIFVLIVLECFVWITGLVPLEQRNIDAYQCIQTKLDSIFEDYER